MLHHAIKQGSHLNGLGYGAFIAPLCAFLRLLLCPFYKFITRLIFFLSKNTFGLDYIIQNRLLDFSDYNPKYVLPRFFKIVVYIISMT